MMYPPREDSFLLEKFVKHLARGFVLDLGTGSGIQAQAAAQRSAVRKVIAADIDIDVVAHCKKSIANKKIVCRKSDLFKNIPEVFDTIVFNPPYLPQELPKRDLALEGGKNGYEVIARFLAQANAHLKTEGSIFLVFSSLTNKQKVEELIGQNLLVGKELGRVHVFFEDIYAYLLKKQPALKRMERAGIRNVQYFAKGRRGRVYTGTHRNRKAAIKVRHPESTAKGRIANEARMLKRVNKLGIGPKFALAGNGFVAYEFVDGEYFEDWLPKARPAEAKKVLRDLFSQCLVLDKAGIAKEEMLRPLKNAIVRRGKVVLIDFERAHRSRDARNVTQLCQFVRSRRNMLAKKGIRVDVRALQDAARHYKQNPSQGNLQVVLEAAGL